LKNLYQVIDKKLSNKEIVTLLGICEPKTISHCMQVGNLTVKDMEIKEDENGISSYEVKFNGEIMLKGEFIKNEAYGGYSFLVDKEHVTKVPHSMQRLIEGAISFDISNKDELEKILGDKLINLSFGKSLPQKVVFNEFTIRYRAEDHASNSANFIKLVND
jgi:hypothetical protein